VFLTYLHFLILLTNIDPDLGMPVGQAQKYFKELIAGVVSSFQ